MGEAMKKAILGLTACLCLLQPTRSSAQETFGSTERWCKDTLTVCWAPHRPMAPGVRIVADIGLGTIVNLREPKTKFSQIPVVGFEVALVQGWLAAQLLLIKPFSVPFQEDTSAALRSGVRDVPVNYGLALGGSAIEGIVELGLGFVVYDSAAFDKPSKFPSDAVFFFHFAPIATIRSVFLTFSKGGASE
jgi:hypothetical protein